MLKNKKVITVVEFINNLIKHEGKELIVDYKGIVDTQIDFHEFNMEEMIDEQGDKCIVLDSNNETGYPLWVKEKDIKGITEIFSGEDYCIQLPNLDLHIYLDC